MTAMPLLTNLEIRCQPSMCSSPSHLPSYPCCRLLNVPSLLACPCASHFCHIGAVTRKDTLSYANPRLYPLVHLYIQRRRCVRPEQSTHTCKSKMMRSLALDPDMSHLQSYNVRVCTSL